MALDAKPLNDLAAKLARELERQDQLFHDVRESLAQLGGDVRLHIPEAMLEELDAAFAPPASTTTNGPLDHLRVRA